MSEPATIAPRSGALRVIWLITVLVSLWLVLCRDLSGEWSVNDQYSYGWFVPFLALYLFWLRWEKRPRAEVGGQRAEGRGQKPRALIATIIALPALFLLLPVRLFEIANPDWRPLGWIHTASVATLTLVYIWYVGGAPWLRHFAFPILFIFTAVPWISPIEEPIVQGLMRVVAAVASETVTLFGIPAQLEGNLIRVNNGLVGVNEACSGVRSLQTSLMIGLLFGELKRLSTWRRVALLLTALAVAFIANCARAFFLVWIAATKNIAAVNRWHDFAGYAIVVAVFVASLILATLLSRRDQKSEARPEVGGQKSEINNQKPFSIPSSVFHLPASRFALLAFCWLVLVEVGAETWYRMHERDLVAVPRWTVLWPKEAPGFHEIKIEPGVRSILRYDDGHEATWSMQTTNLSETTNSAKCVLFVFRWKQGGSTILRARAHRPDICLPSVGWRQVSDRGVAEYAVEGNLSVPFRHIGFAQERRGVVAHTFFCLQEDQLHPAEPWADSKSWNGAQPDWSFRGRYRTVLNGVRNLGQQVVEFVFVSSREMDDATAEAQFAALVRQIIAVTPTAQSH